jgi:Flp pilus assembly protein TadG
MTAAAGAPAPRGDHPVRTRHRSAPRFGDRGYAMAMTALMLVPIMIGAAFAVDVGAWYAQASKEQRAADAASLAGVVFLPDQAKAIQAARDVAASHGFPSTTNCSTTDPVKVCVVPHPAEQRLDVAISAQGKIFFARVANIKTETLGRSATAEYVPSIPMGSPLAQMGNDPTLGFAPDFWLGQDGAANQKGNGDRYASVACNTPSGTGSSTMSGCSGTNSTMSTLANNDEYRTDGYLYVVRVPSTAAGQTINVQAFDPAFVNTGNDCSTYSGIADDDYCTGDNESTGGLAPGVPSGQTAPAGGCTNAASWATADTAANVLCTPTTYILRAPDSTPSDNTDNPAVCGVTFRGWDTGSPGTSTAVDPYSGVELRNAFHKWVTVCSISNAVAGDYVLQVKTNANLTNVGSTPKTASTSGLDLGTTGQSATRTYVSGQNNFSLRAGVSGQTPGTATWSAGINLFADGRLPIYVNSPNADPTFYLAQVTSVYAGTSLMFDFFDIGDGGNAEDVTLTPPPATEAANPPTTCKWTRDGGAMAAASTSAGCTYRNLAKADYNGRLTSVRVDLPASYTCTATTTSKCWFQVKVTTTTPNDFTTWSARVIGDPVHLVQ